MPSRLIVGCMTGTSIDSIDAAAVTIEGTGLSMSPRFVRGITRPLGELGTGLRRLADQEPMSAGEVARLAAGLAMIHVDAIRALLGSDRASLAVIHGQTVYHKPPVSWQLINGPAIAGALGIPIVFDLRAADVAAGGQGAPITPLADWVLFRAAGNRTAIVNLGGFCNVTLLPVADAPGPDPIRAMIDQIRGFDVCPCNHLLDTIARKLMNAPFDDGGGRAMAGSVHDEALEDLDGILRSMSTSRRSLGTGDESGDWISRWRSRIAADDLAATACEAIGHAIADRVQGAGRILLAGGGANNAALARAIESCCSAAVEPIASHGVPGEYREAACMAVLGALCQDRVPITLPQVTGCRAPAPIAGVWIHP